MRARMLQKHQPQGWGKGGSSGAFEANEYAQTDGESGGGEEFGEVGGGIEG